jgi:hypothetical protein
MAQHYTETPLAKEASADSERVVKEVKSGNVEGALKDVHNIIDQMSPEDRKSYLYYLNRDLAQDANEALNIKGFPSAKALLDITETSQSDGSTILAVQGGINWGDGSSDESKIEADFDKTGHMTKYQESPLTTTTPGRRSDPGDELTP